MKVKGPALAGLFFVLSGSQIPGEMAGTRPLSAAGQIYFRQFVERFAPLVVERDRKSGSTPAANPAWHKSNRDCAGLVRYVFREALSAHGAAFYDRYPALHGIAQPAERGELAQALTLWQKANYTARDMLAHAVFTGRNTERRNLKTGDLLYFESAELKIRHVMLVIRSANEVFLIYHTGDDRDELRIRTIPDILGLAESHWHPDAANPVFRGVYRPVFLR